MMTVCRAVKNALALPSVPLRSRLAAHCDVAALFPWIQVIVSSDAVHLADAAAVG